MGLTVSVHLIEKIHQKVLMTFTKSVYGFLKEFFNITWTLFLVCAAFKSTSDEKKIWKGQHKTTDCREKEQYSVFLCFHEKWYAKCKRYFEKSLSSYSNGIQSVSRPFCFFIAIRCIVFQTVSTFLPSFIKINSQLICFQSQFSHRIHRIFLSAFVLFSQFELGYSSWSHVSTTVYNIHLLQCTKYERFTVNNGEDKKMRKKARKPTNNNWYWIVIY